MDQNGIPEEITPLLTYSVVFGICLPKDHKMIRDGMVLDSAVLVVEFEFLMFSCLKREPEINFII